ncbi:DUF2160 domain-containing protein [Chelativorans intermedius]|uniref:DUF2160 domain-containing protein n=1 Tax=Chelativorans intermedius TaxID=515947 RepID=A0ABV6D2Z9_9HYPH|nr:DUF2160 domain-containing protein [Chelativorans intermedius]MCT8998482.1 DUF2160 domain-containing protein [Chelativorans intermedius]
MDLTWMAWTWQTATFFAVIAFLLLGMMLWEYVAPGGGARVGILRFETTRGDRLFISLLMSAYIHLGWLAFSDASLWGATIASLAFAAAVFRWV